MVDRSLKYFYTLDYSEPFDADDGSSASTHARMYTMGDKYGVKALKTIAEAKFESVFASVAEGQAWVSPKPTNAWHGIVSVVEIVYSITPDTDIVLRNIVTAYIWKFLSFFTGLPDFEKMLAQTPDLALVLVMKTASKQRTRNHDEW